MHYHAWVCISKLLIYQANGIIAFSSISKYWNLSILPLTCTNILFHCHRYIPTPSHFCHHALPVPCIQSSLNSFDSHMYILTITMEEIRLGLWTSQSPRLKNEHIFVIGLGLTCKTKLYWFCDLFNTSHNIYHIVVYLLLWISVICSVRLCYATILKLKVKKISNKTLHKKWYVLSIQ